MSKNNLRRFYQAAYSLIHRYNMETNSGDIAGFAGSMELFRSEESSSDPAIWGDWLNAIKKIKNFDFVPESLTIEEAYQAAIIFFNFEADLWASDNLQKFTESLTYEKWLEAVKAVDDDS